MSIGFLGTPRRLIRQDITAGFHSGATELDDWFQRYAWQNQKANNAVVYVTAQDDVILGYYAITTATYSRNDAPQGLNHRSRPEEIPYILLARIAVDERACHPHRALPRRASTLLLSRQRRLFSITR